MQRTPLIDGNRKSFVFEVCVDCELGSKRKTQKSLTVYKFRGLIVFYKFCIIGTL